MLLDVPSKVVTPLGLHGKYIRHLRVNPNGREIAFTEGEASSRLWVFDGLPAAGAR